MEERIESGKLMVRAEVSSDNKAEVNLGLEDGDFKFLHDTADLLSPYTHHVRDLNYMYIEELIRLIPKVKEEGVGNKEVVAVFETVLLALDYLADPKFKNVAFNEQHSNYLDELTQDCFNIEKKHSFQPNSTRPRINKGKIIEDGKNTHAIDSREDKTRIYMAVLYKKPESLFEHFKHVASVLAEMPLDNEMANTPYEDAMKGMRDCELHDYFIYNINRVSRTLPWFLNSYSCRENELAEFDKMEISLKLGV